MVMDLSEVHSSYSGNLRRWKIIIVTAENILICLMVLINKLLQLDCYEHMFCALTDIMALYYIGG
jgi:hypothetical protein